MKKVIVLGSGAMGSALGHCMVRGGCEVVMVMLPYDEEMLKGGGEHLGLGLKLDEGLTWCGVDDVKGKMWEGSDMVVVAVSSEGLGWAEGWLRVWEGYVQGVVFATKGLPTYKPSLCFLEGMKGRDGGEVSVSVMGGPCLAKELARGEPTSLVVAGKDEWLCEEMRDVLGVLSHVYVEVSYDFEGVAWSAALKNLYAIGVSAGEKEGVRNGAAGLFSQSVKEMGLFLRMLGMDESSVWGLAGVGDLYVTIGGGRNGKFGRLLGEGLRRDEIMGGEMKGVTVEGLHAAEGLQSFLESMEGGMEWESFPLMRSLLRSLVEGKKFECSPWIV